MAFSSATVSVGGVTRQSDYQRVMDNTVYNRDKRIIHVQDQKSSGTGGGVFNSGSWLTRDLNTEIENTITGASLSSSTITLPAGTYRVSAYSTAYFVNGHMMDLYNVTLGSVITSGCTAYSATSANNNTLSIIDNEKFVITGATDITLRHRCQATRAISDGRGIPANFTVPHELYSNVFIEKIG